MADMSSPDSRLPWLWVIEYLASFKQIETSILHDLIEMAPELPNDLGKNTREMVALRCLEDLFGPSNELTNNVPSALDSRVEFDVSESCEDVLQCILQETSASDLKMVGTQTLKWDVHPFIIQKRSHMPKCALQQLKDTILEGTRSYAASLKESSGLVPVNECNRMPVDDGVHHALTWRPDENGNDSQTVAAEGNLITLTPENGNGLNGADSHNRNILPSKRDRNDLTTEILAGPESQDGMSYHDDLHVNAKKLKHDASCTNQSVGKISVPLQGDELAEDSSERVVRVTEGQGRDLAKESQVGGSKEGSFPDDACDEYVGSKSFGQSSNVDDDKLHHNQSEIACNANKMLQDASVDGFGLHILVDEVNNTEPRTSTIHREVCVDEAKDNSDHNLNVKLPNAAPSNGSREKSNADETKCDVEHLCEDEVSSDSDECHDERIDVATEKNNFLSYQCTYHDSLATADWTDQNLCVKCNKDGQLLSCSTSGCPLMVHENCLGSATKFDDKGNFYCPFCAYSFAISEYLEAKKKASLARKELAAFIHRGLEHRPKELTKRLQRKEQSNTRQNGDEDFVKTHENGDLGEREQIQANQNGENVNEVNDHQFTKSVSDEQQSEPSAPCANVNSPCRNEEENLISGISTSGKEGEENTCQECPSAGLEGQPDRVPIPECDGDNLSSENTEIVPVNQRQAGGGIQEENLQQLIPDPCEKPVCALNIDGEETSEAESDAFIISKYSIRFRRRERQYTYPPIPQLRRKKVPWTAKEEEILKVGVQKFSSVDDRNIPWKKILEFGGSVFLNGRTTIDLKDKWRNMCKGSPKPK